MFEQKLFFFHFPDCVSSCPFRINNFYSLHISSGMQLEPLSDFRFATLSPFWVGNVSSTSSQKFLPASGFIPHIIVSLMLGILMPPFI